MTLLYVYVIGITDGPQKIGITGNLGARLLALQNGCHAQLTRHFAVPHRDARAIEASSHRLLAEKRLKGEWFDCSPTEAIEAVVSAIWIYESDVPAPPVPEPVRVIIPANRRLLDAAQAVQRNIARLQDEGVEPFLEKDVECELMDAIEAAGGSLLDTGGRYRWGYA